MTLPLWLVIIAGGLASVTVVEWILIPSVRWFIQRRVNRIIDDINTCLDIEIKPFQLAKRQVLIDRLVHDPVVQKVIAETSQQEGIPRDVIQQKATRYAKEIVPSFNAYIYFRLGYWLAKKIARLLYRIRVNFSNEARLGEVDSNATVVFVINHRSNMDYILVAFLAAEKTALSYAVGEWAKIWPLQSLIRAMGAFFVRRNSGNSLYRRVLERYIYMATEQGVCQAVFPEGGLSRDGKLRSPKLGLIDYMLRHHHCDGNRDIVFVPVGLNYDRTMEDRTLLHGLNPDNPKRSKLFVVKTTLKFVWQNIRLMAQNRWRKFGYACVHFGEPISIREYCGQHQLAFDALSTNARFEEVDKLANLFMAKIAEVVPVLPIPIAARVMLEAGEPLSSLEVLARAQQMIKTLEQKGAVVAFPTRTRTFALENALNMLRIRRLIQEQNGKLKTTDHGKEVLHYYANSIDFWFEAEVNEKFNGPTKQGGDFRLPLSS